MSDVYLALASYALRCTASGIERKLLGATAKKSNAAQVSYAYEQIQIQGERFDAGEPAAITPVRISELDFVRRAGYEFAQLLPLK